MRLLDAQAESDGTKTAHNWLEPETRSLQVNSHHLVEPRETKNRLAMLNVAVSKIIVTERMLEAF